MNKEKSYKNALTALMTIIKDQSESRNSRILSSHWAWWKTGNRWIKLCKKWTTINLDSSSWKSFSKLSRMEEKVRKKAKLQMNKLVPSIASSMVSPRTSSIRIKRRRASAYPEKPAHASCLTESRVSTSR